MYKLSDSSENSSSIIYPILYFHMFKTLMFWVLNGKKKKKKGLIIKSNKL